jgi:hypothetical protein
VFPPPLAKGNPDKRVVIQWDRRIIMQTQVLVAAPQVKRQLLVHPAGRTKLDRLIFPGIAENPGKIGVATVGNGDRESSDHVIHDMAAGLGEVADQVGPVLAIDFNGDHHFIVGQFRLVHGKHLGLNDGLHLARRIRIFLLRKYLSVVFAADRRPRLPGQYSDHQDGGRQQDQHDPGGCANAFLGRCFRHGGFPFSSICVLRFWIGNSDYHDVGRNRCPGGSWTAGP